ncbi:probable peptidyl-tRNA hydrolase 2 [Anopheles merus]|uniref:probable peptidyl-tRNA hydrolase 2 n=1 Tax=Anopheles merus TaxID=30066 RepID=UPI001BE4BCD0|nr:probable peptidyl-tRNA hydrolase 2 [Anopheles merus]
MSALLRKLFATVGGSVVGGAPMKMVLVVRSDLGLKKGKIASQCAHAAVLCCMRAASAGGDAAGRGKMLDAWLRQGQPKIVLRVDSLQELHLLTERAESSGVIAEIVRDAGRTQGRFQSAHSAAFRVYHPANVTQSLLPAGRAGGVGLLSRRSNS